MSAGTSTRELAAALDVSERAVRKRFSIVAELVDGAHVYALDSLPEDCRNAVLRLRATKAKEAAEIAASSRRSAEISQKWAEFEKAEAWRRNRATERALILEDVERRAAAGLSFKAAVVAAIEEGADTSLRNATRWRVAVKGVARLHWPAFLLPDPMPGNRRAEIHPDALSWLIADYCRAERPTAAMCCERLRHIAKGQKSEWLPLPSDRRILDRLKEVDPAMMTYGRDGKEAAERLGPQVTRSVEHMNVMDLWDADGHRLDVRVVFPDGKVGRPTLLAWQDIKSRMIVGWRLGTTETADLACLSFADAVRAWGLPHGVHLDNGRAFASRGLSGGALNRHRWNDPARDWNGMLSTLHVGVHFVLPYSGRSKPIERAFQDIRDRVTADDRCKGACTGNDPLDKPHNYGSAAVPWSIFMDVVRDAIADHNQKPGRTAEACNGRSFAQTHADLYQQAPVRMATEAQLRLLLLDSRPLKVSKDAEVKVFGNRYWTPELCRHIGEQVVVRFDPDSLKDGVHVFLPDSTYLFHAGIVGKIRFNDKTAAKTRAKEKADWNKRLRDGHRAMQEAAKALDIKPRNLLDHVTHDKPKPAAVVPLGIDQRRKRQAEQRSESATVLDHPTIRSPKRRAR